MLWSSMEQGSGTADEGAGVANPSRRARRARCPRRDKSFTSPLMRNSEVVHETLLSFLEKHTDLMQQGNHADLPGVPIRRVRAIMMEESCDPQPLRISKGALTVVKHAAEVILCSIVQIAYKVCEEQDRTTVRLEDMKTAIQASSLFDFLIDVPAMFAASGAVAETRDSVEKPISDACFRSQTNAVISLPTGEIPPRAPDRLKAPPRIIAPVRMPIIAMAHPGDPSIWSAWRSGNDSSNPSSLDP